MRLKFLSVRAFYVLERNSRANLGSKPAWDRSGAFRDLCEGRSILLATGQRRLVSLMCVGVEKKEVRSREEGKSPNLGRGR